MSAERTGMGGSSVSCGVNGIPSSRVLSTDAIGETRRNHYISSVVHYYRKPLHVAKASMQWVWDREGKRYLDALGGIVTISAGHNHPRIKNRLKAWLDEDGPQHTTTFYFASPMAEAAQRLVAIAPEGLKRAFFTNSGSEANELAILVARQYTKRFEIVALKHGYHGATAGTLSLVGQHTWKWGGPSLPGISHAAQPNCYRCPWGGSPENCGLECANDVEDTIRTTTSGEIAAFIAEPIQGVGGFIVPPKEYFPRVLEIVRKYGGLYVSDEVQTGVGRTGRHWFGVLHNGITPDIMTMAKGLGNGASIGGFLAKDEIGQAMKGKIHFSTYACNPWATMQAAETLAILQEENVLETNERLGGLILDGLREIQKSSRFLGDVRGRGLLLGLELVKDKKTKEYHPEATVELMEQTRERGLLVGKGGLFGNVVRLTPPMCITEGDAREIVRILGESIRETERRMS